MNKSPDAFRTISEVDLATFRDVSARRAAVQELSASEARFRAAQVLVVDPVSE